jgi:hypothetical protein
MSHLAPPTASLWNNLTNERNRILQKPFLNWTNSEVKILRNLHYNTLSNNYKQLLNIPNKERARLKKLLARNETVYITMRWPNLLLMNKYKHFLNPVERNKLNNATSKRIKLFIKQFVESVMRNFSVREQTQTINKMTKLASKNPTAYLGALEGHRRVSGAPGKSMINISALGPAHKSKTLMNMTNFRNVISALNRVNINSNQVRYTVNFLRSQFPRENAPPEKPNTRGMVPSERTRALSNYRERLIGWMRGMLALYRRGV